MIRSFRDRNSRRLFEGKRVAAYQGFARWATRRLVLPDCAETLLDLAVLSSNRLEALRGDRAGQLSIRLRRGANGLQLHAIQRFPRKPQICGRDPERTLVANAWCVSSSLSAVHLITDATPAFKVAGSENDLDIGRRVLGVDVAKGMICASAFNPSMRSDDERLSSVPAPGGPLPGQSVDAETRFHPRKVLQVHGANASVKFVFRIVDCHECCSRRADRGPFPAVPHF